MSYRLPFQNGDEVVELGGGDNAVIKRIQGLKAINLDVRDVPGVDIVRDLEGDFSDAGSFDGLFAQYLAEHISWPKVEGFLENCAKILKPGKPAVFVVPDTYAQMQKILLKSPEEIDFDDSNMLFGGQDYSDNTHKWLISRPFFTKLLEKAGFDRVSITSHPNPDARDMFVEAYKKIDSKPTIVVGAVKEADIKINFGSFTVTFGDGWINADIRADIRPAVEAKGHIFKHCDVREPLPWSNGTVALITAHHLIEHLDRDEGAFFLNECHRVLKAGGIIRLSTPDIEKFVDHYKARNFKEAFKGEYEADNGEDNADAFFRLAFLGHKTIYDYNALRAKMESVGFKDLREMPEGASNSPEIMTETVDSFPNHSFYIEGTKQSKHEVEEEEIGETIDKLQEQRNLDYKTYLQGGKGETVAITIPTTKEQYVTPFKPDQKILDIGGGEHPLFRPNLDKRSLPTVDIVADLEKPLPIEDGEYDGVFSNMTLEHVGWRHVAPLVKEIHRILKPSGVTAHITSNTLEQCKEIVNRGAVTVAENAMLYGGQEGTEEETGNYHKSAFSPTYAKQLFQEAGFRRTEVKPLPGCYLDMIIEAYK